VTKIVDYGLRNSAHHTSAGFTILEIIITMTLISSIAALGVTVGIDVYRSGTLSAERDLVVSGLEKARSMAITNTGSSDHGLYIENNKHTIFRGNSYELRNPDYDVAVPNSPRITSTGTLEFVFEQLSGDGLISGTTTLVDETGVSRDISVNAEGRINW